MIGHTVSAISSGIRKILRPVQNCQSSNLGLDHPSDLSNEKERVWVHTCHTLFKQNDNAIALVYDDDMQGKIDKHHHNFFAGMFRTHGYVRSLSFCWPCKKQKKEDIDPCSL